MTRATKVGMLLVVVCFPAAAKAAEGKKKLALADFALPESLRKDLLPSTLSDLLLKEGRSSAHYEVAVPNSYLGKVIDRYRDELRLGKAPATAVKPGEAGADLLLIPSASRLEKQMVVSATLIDLRTLQPVGTYVVQREGTVADLLTMAAELWRRVEVKVLWKYEAGGRIRHLTATEGWLACWSHDGHIYVLDRQTGEVRWKEDSVIRDDVELTAKAIYYGDKKGVHKVALDSGKEAWHVAVTGGAYAPVKAGEFILIAGADGHLRCLEDADGKERWRHAFRDLKYSSNVLPTAPVLAEGRIFFTYSGGVHAVGLDDGRALWLTKTETGGNHHRLVPHDRTIYLVSPDTHHLQSFQCADGKQGWNYHLSWTGGNKDYPRPLAALPWGLQRLSKSMITTRAASSGKTLFLALEREDKGPSFLAAVKPEDPLVRWTFSLEEKEDVVIDRPFVTRQTVFISTLLGRVYAVDVDSGRRKWKLDVNELEEFERKSAEKGGGDKPKWSATVYPANWRLASHPAVFGEAVYFATMSGTVYAVRWR